MISGGHHAVVGCRQRYLSTNVAILYCSKEYTIRNIYPNWEYLANSVGTALPPLASIHKIIIPIYGLFHILPIFAECCEVFEFTSLYSVYAWVLSLFPVAGESCSAYKPACKSSWNDYDWTNAISRIANTGDILSRLWFELQFCILNATFFGISPKFAYL